ncbi:integrative conjugative element protein, RAQPRD family [Lonsdalea quercina]|uniref:integrative conjugative element protein, RAQPRD family n=1 Tax=Lonsdalea quercina TaxID=71657 RepID=UPI00397625FA
MTFLTRLCLSATMLAGPVYAIPTTEQASLALMLTQLDHIEATLQRAQAQASLAPAERFFFDYPQACADIKAIRTGIQHYLVPARAQPRTIVPLSGRYRLEEPAQ